MVTHCTKKEENVEIFVFNISKTLLGLDTDPQKQMRIRNTEKEKIMKVPRTCTIGKKVWVGQLMASLSGFY
jgi:hypothetical protein